MMKPTLKINVLLLLASLALCSQFGVASGNPGLAKEATPDVITGHGSMPMPPGQPKVGAARKHPETGAAAPVSGSTAGATPAILRPVQADCRKQGETPRPAPPKRCEPQSLTYARQRSGIMSCRNGRENGPMTWFAAEKQAGRTSDDPAAGSVLILKGQGHGMPTGHVAYVEEVFPEGPTTYRLIFSHTNYDRRCSLETDIDSLYDRAAMTLDVHSGAWRSWGRGLKVAGFIHRGEGAKAPVVATGNDLQN